MNVTVLLSVCLVLLGFAGGLVVGSYLALRHAARELAVREARRRRYSRA